LNAIPAQLPTPAPETFQDYVSTLDPALRSLVSDVEMVWPMAEIVQLLEITTTLTLVGDGGAKTCRGSYGADASLDSIRIIKVKGPVTGPDPRSYRAEAHAMAAILICVVLLHKVAPHQANQYRVLDLYSDNQGLVDKIKEMMEWATMYPSNALASEFLLYSPTYPSFQ
jgi:hypothetical protein